ncbi:MAG: Apolipoprotein N-acyltransferase [Chlamydiae bacterium]|nr:Apolipoprotein N-acyltransferase [Chlamydiota bacterium]
MTRAELFFSSFIGFLIVAFGQPSFALPLAPLAAAVGYALFWRCVRIFPFPIQRFWRGALWYTIVAMVQLSWMTAYEYQGIYILAVFGALAIWLGVQFGLLTLLIPYNRSISIARGLAIASLWTLFEWGRFYFICGFSWNPAGLALSTPFAMQSASLLGVLGLSFWVIFVNVLGLRALIKKRGRAYWAWGVAALLPYTFGLVHTVYHEKVSAKKRGAPFTCILVQTGLLPQEKVPLNGQLQAFISPYSQWKRIFSYIGEHEKSHPNLIVLPEAALPYPGLASIYSQKQIKKDLMENFESEKIEALFSDPGEEGDIFLSNADVAQTLANLLGSEVIAGLDHCGEKGSHYNSAFHFVPQGMTQTRYDKRVLMPLAEYLPYEWLRPLVSSYGIKEFFTPGDKPKLFRGALAMSVSICYEETFPGHVRDGCNLGADLIVNVTNDVWFPDSRLPSQHYEHSRLRAVENGVPLVRACNTGVTAAVDSLGREVSRLSEKDSEGRPMAAALKTEIVLYTYKTLFSHLGNGGILGLSTLCLANFIFFGRLFKW